MARLMILASLFAADTLAKRIATKPAQTQGLGIAPGVVPVSVQVAAPLRPAVMHRQSAPVGMAIREAGHPGKHPAPVRKDWEALDTEPDVWMSVADDQDADLALEEVAAAEAEQAAADAREKQKRFELNARRAYDSLSSDIPLILAWDSMPGFDIYTDDFETDFTNPINPTALAMFSSLFAASAPPWLASIKGKAAHKAVLQEERTLLDKFTDGEVEVTGQDWCMAKDGADWCVLMEEVSGAKPELSIHEGEQVMKSYWKTDLKLTPSLQEVIKNYLLVDGETLGAVVTVQALSIFYLNDEGKIYRHSIDQLDILLNQESMKPQVAQLLLIKLVDARGKK